MIKRFDVSLRFYVCMIALAVALPLKLSAQSNYPEDGSDDINMKVSLPAFEAGFSAGFNYDLLRSPTSVSFEYPMGFMGMNIPFGSNIGLRAVGGSAIDEIFDDDELFTNGRDYKPEVGIQQSVNYTVMVDMPMLGGVGSFAYTRNFFLNYNTNLGNSEISIAPNFEDLRENGIELDLFMRGGVSIPLQLSAGWETVTFGYAYRLHKDVVFALNLHRHLFTMDFRGRADVDLMGNLHAQIDAGQLGDLTLTQLLDFPAEMANGSITGKFSATAWTPTIGVKLGRLSLASRFGLSTKAKGSVRGQYRMPDIIDVETGEFTVDLNDNISADDAVTLINRLTDVSADSIVYESTENMHWKLPQGHTVMLDVIRDVFSLSYTKTFGDIEMRINNIVRTSAPLDENGNRREGSNMIDTLNIDVGVTVDHVIMANLTLLRTFFLNIGVFGFDLRSEDKENIVGGAMPKYLRLGKTGMLPVLSFGGTAGSKIKLHIDCDLLPLPAVRTGIYYHF